MSDRWRAQLDSDRSELSAAEGGTITGRRPMSAEFADEARSFLAGHAPPRQPEVLEWGQGDENLALFHETTGDEEAREVAEAKDWQGTKWKNGFGWLTGPERFGGRDLSPEHDRLYRAIEAEFAVPDVSPLRVGLSTVSPSLVANGSDDQIIEFAVPIQQGSTVACQLFSEPDAGSDLANVKTRARRDGDCWRITGQKVWTSNAQFADVGLALVRTDPDAPKHRGLTAFLLPMKADGVDVRPLRQLTGGASFTEVFLDDVVVDDGRRVGDVGGGWRVAVSTLAAERTSTGDRSHGMTARALGLLRELARRDGCSADPIVRQTLADLEIRLRVARYHQQRMQTVRLEERRGPERALDKLMLSDNLERIGRAAADLLGPRITADTGEWGTFAWRSWVLGAPGYRLGGGTDEVLKTMVGERLLGLPREPTPSQAAAP
ncbi:MAG TPA: acyl-CoA dehydrogenase family protein [Acidimicrobiales bacterium]|jgi:alkylation response protein AidB-like acyl-CoA dehydrogenase|nr:acyl-CoA dehydrogenase family protein [Acidimicrobiales bacterium]